MTRVQEIKKAILNGDEKYQNIPLPKRQTAGTDHQIISYAQVQAQEFYNKHFL